MVQFRRSVRTLPDDRGHNGVCSNDPPDPLDIFTGTSNLPSHGNPDSLSPVKSPSHHFPFLSPVDISTIAEDASTGSPSPFDVLSQDDASTQGEPRDESWDSTEDVAPEPTSKYHQGSGHGGKSISSVVPDLLDYEQSTLHHQNVPLPPPAINSTIGEGATTAQPCLLEILSDDGPSMNEEPFDGPWEGSKKATQQHNSMFNQGTSHEGRSILSAVGDTLEYDQCLLQHQGGIEKDSDLFETVDFLGTLLSPISSSPVSEDVPIESLSDDGTASNGERFDGSWEDTKIVAQQPNAMVYQCNSHGGSSKLPAVADTVDYGQYVLEHQVGMEEDSDLFDTVDFLGSIMSPFPPSPVSEDVQFESDSEHQETDKMEQKGQRETETQDGTQMQHIQQQPQNEEHQDQGETMNESEKHETHVEKEVQTREEVNSDEECPSSEFIDGFLDLNASVPILQYLEDDFFEEIPNKRTGSPLDPPCSFENIFEGILNYDSTAQKSPSTKPLECIQTIPLELKERMNAVPIGDPIAPQETDLSNRNIHRKRGRPCKNQGSHSATRKERRIAKNSQVKKIRKLPKARNWRLPRSFYRPDPNSMVRAKEMAATSFSPSVSTAHPTSKGAYGTAAFMEGSTSLKGKSRERVACPHCPKSFWSREVLESHCVVHTGDKPYLCPVPSCGKRFSWRSSIAYHCDAHFERGDIILVEGVGPVAVEELGSTTAKRNTCSAGK